MPSGILHAPGIMPSGKLHAARYYAVRYPACRQLLCCQVSCVSCMRHLKTAFDLFIVFKLNNKVKVGPFIWARGGFFILLCCPLYFFVSSHFHVCLLYLFLCFLSLLLFMRASVWEKPCCMSSTFFIPILIRTFFFCFPRIDFILIVEYY